MLTPSRSSSLPRRLGAANACFFESATTLATLPSLQTDVDSDAATISSCVSPSSLEPFSPRFLYAESFDRPQLSSQHGRSPSMNASNTPRYRKKNIHDFTGFGTMSEEDFLALPVAVRRKYCSSTERLRFAPSSSLPSSAADKPTLAERRGLNAPAGGIRTSSPKTLRKSSKGRSPAACNTSWLLTAPTKAASPKCSATTTAASPKRSATDIRRTTRRRQVKPLVEEPAKMDIYTDPDSNGINHILESFRWMDDSNLDLSLLPFDNYHANLDGVVLPSPTSPKRPSFRRQLSVSGLPFADDSPLRSPVEPLGPASQNRQRSKTFTHTRHVTQASVTSIDRNAQHYKDPDARMKLRVYLASPQHFDEAVQFGFPAVEGADKENHRPSARSSRDQHRRPSNIDTRHTFFHDEAVSLYTDDRSEVESDMPLTPLEVESGYDAPGHTSKKTSEDYSHLGIRKPMLVKVQDAAAPMSNREMTLRMTLTRPDLRADESVIYGSAKSSLQMPPSFDFEREEVRGPFGGLDGWGPPDRDGVVRRLWHKISSRKSS